MGYNTEFKGHFTLNKNLTNKHSAYLNKFSNTIRMKRYADVLNTGTLLDPIREAVKLPVGIDGEYFVGGCGNYGQSLDNSVKEHNYPPITQPGLWCQWVPTRDSRGIEWSGAEKFYYYTEWLEYIVTNFIKPWCYVLSGAVSWEGDDCSDVGVITVVDNIVIAKPHSIA